MLHLQQLMLQGNGFNGSIPAVWQHRCILLVYSRTCPLPRPLSNDSIHLGASYCFEQAFGL